MNETNKQHKDLKEGDIDPSLGKVIKSLILQTDNFIVYVDDDLDIEWYHTDHIKTDSNFGRILNKVAYLSTISGFISNKAKLLSIRAQIAEGVARHLEYSSLSISSEILNIAERQINELNRKTSWSWYFGAVYAVTIMSLFLWGIIWLVRDSFTSYIGRAGIEVVLGGLIGVIGAIISVVSRGDKLNLDANAGRSIHFTEGIARIVVGMAGAALVALALKGGMIFSGVSFNGNQFAVLLTLSIVAGASERLVPSLISKVEKISLSKFDISLPEQKGTPND